MPERPPNRFLFAIRQSWENLPVVFVLYTAFHMLHSALYWMSPPQPDWAWTIVFPLFWVFAFLGIGLQRGPQSKGGVLYVFTCAVAAGIVAVFLLTRPGALSLDRIVFQHEYATYVWVALLMIHCLVTRGPAGFAVFFAIGLLYGGLLESSGIRMQFFFEPDYHWYAPAFLRPIFVAPMTTILGWTTVFYPTVFITEKIFEKLGIGNVFLKAVNASLVGLFIDLQVDPVASAVGLWNWNDELLPGFLGVPTLNFVSWFWAVVPFAYMVFYISGKQDWKVRKRLLALLVSVPFCQAIAGLATFSTMLLLEGRSSPALEILFAGIKAQLGPGG